MSGFFASILPALLTLLLAALPVLLAYYLNATFPAPITHYAASRCTRYCTLHGYRHDTRANIPVYFQLRPVYAGTIRALRLGGHYQLANVGFYLVCIPALLLWLGYGELRDAGRIWRLRA